MEHLFLPIQKETPVPLYFQIKQVILQAIQQGVLKPGMLLPGEMEFCKHYAVSRPTVRQAMSELVSDGWLERRRGCGTYVANPKIEDKFLNRLQSFEQEMRQKGLTATTQVLQFGAAGVQPAVAEKLQCPPDTELLCLERLRFADGMPVVHVITWMPRERFRALEHVDFVLQSLYATMEQCCGATVVRARREIEAVNLTSAVAALLGVPRGSAACLVRSVAYTDKNEAVEYSVASYRGDRTKFSVELCRFTKE